MHAIVGEVQMSVTSWLKFALSTPLLFPFEPFLPPVPSIFGRSCRWDIGCMVSRYVRCRYSICHAQICNATYRSRQPPRHRMSDPPARIRREQRDKFSLSFRPFCDSHDLRPGHLLRLGQRVLLGTLAARKLAQKVASIGMGRAPGGRQHLCSLQKMAARTLSRCHAPHTCTEPAVAGRNIFRRNLARGEKSGGVAPVVL